VIAKYALREAEAQDLKIKDEKEDKVDP